MDGRLHELEQMKVRALLTSLTKPVGQLLRKSNVFFQLVRRAYQLARDERIVHPVDRLEHNTAYQFNALYSGIAMNHGDKGDVYNLRRNIHRIEKGLIQKRPKQLFAENYILDTVKFVIKLKQNGACDNNTILWAEAALKQYFSVCNHEGPVLKAFSLFEQSSRDESRESPWYPYTAESRPETVVDYHSMHQLALRRRSVRYYLNKSVEFDIVRLAMEIAALSPSACNRQSFQFLFYDQKDIVNAICAIPGGYAGFEAPSVVMVVGRYRGYFDERDANVPIIDASLAVMAFILTLETLGLSSVCINWPLLPDRDRAIRNLVHLDDDEFVVMLIAIGYADPEGRIPYSAKRDIDSLISCNNRIYLHKDFVADTAETLAGVGCAG